MEIKKIIDNHTAQQISEAAGISLSLAKQWKTGEKDWRNSKYSTVLALQQAYGRDDLTAIVESDYLTRFDGSPTIATLLNDAATQQIIQSAVRVATYNINEEIDNELRDRLPDMLIDGLTGYAKDWSFWWGHRDKILPLELSDATMQLIVETIDSGNYVEFIDRVFPDWEEKA